MSEPELWTRCPKATRTAAMPYPWRCVCHGIGEMTLVRLPFDEAVERMRQAYHEWMRGAVASPSQEPPELMSYLLRAALGGEV